MSYNPSVADTSQLLIGSPLVLVPGVEALDGPGRDRASVDVTAIDDSVQKLLSGKAKLQDVTFNLRWDPANAQHAALEAANKANTQIACQIIYSDAGAATLTFTATVPTWKHAAHQDSPNAVAVALRPTTDWVLTP
jgi:hypothetical protein